MLKEALELYYEDEASSQDEVERKDFQFGIKDIHHKNGESVANLKGADLY